MPKENSKVKDSVFVDLFQTYEKLPSMTAVWCDG